MSRQPCYFISTQSAQLLSSFHNVSERIYLGLKYLWCQDNLFNSRLLKTFTLSGQSTPCLIALLPMGMSVLRLYVRSLALMFYNKINKMFTVPVSETQVR